MRVMLAGSRLTLRRALKVTFSRALARSATPCLTLGHLDSRRPGAHTLTHRNRQIAEKTSLSSPF